MAVYRQIHTSFWQDPEMVEYEPEEKYFYLYLMTNPHTTQCGIYEISPKLMSLELGYLIDTVSILLKKFIDRQKILYSKDTNEVFLLNWLKYNSLKSPKVMACVNKELKDVKYKPFLKVFYELCIVYEYPIDSLSIDYGEEEEEKEKEKEEKEEEEVNLSSLSDDPRSHTPYTEIVDAFNQICISLPKVQAINKKRKDTMRARWKEYPDIEFFKQVFTLTEQSDFLSGRNGKWTGCNFDWIIKPSNIVKIMEGTYTNKGKKEPQKRIPRAFASLMELEEGGTKKQ